jgi:hypothetical protein
MKYAIIRVARLKSFASIRGSAKHTFREIDTPNADPDRKQFNTAQGAKSAGEVADRVKARLPDRRRRDAVLCLEYLVTASPEWWRTAPREKQNEYLKRAVHWLKERHGEENFVSLCTHLDEKTPHLVAYFVPITPDGRLSAKHFIGGAGQLAAMYTDFAERVGKPVGLIRGLEGSAVRHVPPKAYGNAIRNNTLPMPLKPPAPSLKERLTGAAKKALDEYHDQLAERAKVMEQIGAEAQLARDARHAQVEAISRMRAELAELAGYRDEVEVLREQVDKLKAELAKKDNLNKALSAALQTVNERIAQLARKVGALPEGGLVNRPTSGENET